MEELEKKLINLFSEERKKTQLEYIEFCLDYMDELEKLEFGENTDKFHIIWNHLKDQFNKDKEELNYSLNKIEENGRTTY